MRALTWQGKHDVRVETVPDPLAQPDDSREAIEHTKPMVVRPGDEQPAIIGAKVECGIERAAMAARIGGGGCPLVHDRRGHLGPCPLHRRRTGWNMDRRLVG